MDRVRPLKIESPSEGGTQTDTAPRPVDPSQDYIESRGAIYQNASSTDTTVGQGRRAATNDWEAFDGVVGAAAALNDLAGVPYQVPAGNTFHVLPNRQCVMGMSVKVDGFILNDGFIVMRGG